MSFRDYLRLEGGCAVALGLVLVLEAALFGDWERPAWFAPAVAVVASAFALRIARDATRSALRRASERPPRMAAAAVRRQTIAETVAWAVAVGAWVAATGDSAELIAGTGVATIVFGVVRLRADVPPELRVDRRRYVLGADATRGAGPLPAASPGGP